MSEHRSDLQTGAFRFPGIHSGQPAVVAWRRAAQLLLFVLVGVAAYLGLRGQLGELPARTIAIFIFAAVCWATEVIPLYATSFLVVAAEILLLAVDGGLAQPVTALVEALGFAPAPWSLAPGLPPAKAAMFLAPFSNEIMFLFMGGFLLSAAVSRHGLDRVIARLCLRPFRRRPMGLLCAVALSSAFLSMWMSNTATAAMLMAVIRPLLQSIPPRDPYRAGLALSVCVGANIGGIGTPIGSPPNAIAFAALRSAGFDITFLGWMAMALPLALVLLAAGIAILWLFHKPSLEFALHPDTWGDHGQEPRITPMARITLAVLLVAVAGWIFGDYAGISPGVVALIAAAMLTATRALNQHDVDSIDWNVLILIWGGLSLSVAMDVSGLTMMVAAIDMARIPGGPWFIGAALALTAMGMSTFMSNTATAGLLVPMALALGVQDREELAIVAALACSFAMALPVSTPPNAIVHASGAVPLAHMIRNGILIGLLSAGLMLAGYRLVLPLVVKPPLSARQPGGG